MCILASKIQTTQIRRREYTVKSGHRSNNSKQLHNQTVVNIVPLKYLCILTVSCLLVF